MCIRDSIGVDRPGGGHHLPGHVCHLLQAEFGPTALPLGVQAHLAPASREEEVVQDDLVEQGRRLPHDVQIAGAVDRVGVAQNVEDAVLLVAVDFDGGGDAAGYGNAMGGKEGLDGPHALGGDVVEAAVGLQVRLVQRQIALEGGYACLLYTSRCV